jgi:lipopolysaccharide export system protein LptC
LAVQSAPPIAASAAVAPAGGALAGIERRPPAAVPGAGYSRFVALMKFLLPAVAVGLLLLVIAWPRLQPGVERLRIGIPKVDISDASDFRMLNARYSGIDKQNRPFTITAEAARQMSGKDDLLALETPKADMTMQSGAWLAITADTGTYQSRAQKLDLFGHVELFHDRGYEFRTDSAYVDMAAGVAEGDKPVEGQGVFGTVTAQGFRMLDRGTTIVFTGKSHLVLESHPGGPPP